jgi:dTDP-4-dehydrorhamnose reductase
MMKILVTGASGMLANDIIPVLERQGYQLIKTDLRPRLPDIQPMDLTHQQQVSDRVSDQSLDYVFHLGAETDVDLCERDPDHAFRVNTLGTENVALACQKFDVKLVYISTAGVFYGDKPSAYTEFDQPRPANFYGESKWQGEIVVKNLLSQYFIVRAGWMIGGWELDKKFVFKIIQQLLAGKKELRVVNDKFGSPTFTKDFAKNLLKIVSSERFGLYHLANQGTCSRYDIALKIVEFMDLQDEVRVIPINSAQFPLSAPRARSEMMQNYRLDLLGINDMPHWEESLKDYIKNNLVHIEKAIG